MNICIISLMRLLRMSHGQVFVGWVKPYTAYPARDALLIAEVFLGLTMKNHVFNGRDKIEKRCWKRFAYPNLQRFQVTSWSHRNDFRDKKFSSVFPEIGIHKHSWKNKFMNQNPLTNFEYMHYLIDETPSYVPKDQFS